MATVAKRSPLTSATGILALLDHDNNTIREEALKLLYPIVDVFWAEIAQKVDVIEALSEEEKFGDRACRCGCVEVLLSLGASTMLNLPLALEAFRYRCQNQYVETMLARGVDRYIQCRKVARRYTY